MALGIGVGWRRPFLWSILLLQSLFLPAAFYEATGLTPEPMRVDHPPIVIAGNSDFTAANGVTAGTGKPDDPFVLEGWRILTEEGDIGIDIRDTTAPFVIRDVDVGPQGASLAPDSIGVRLHNVAFAALEHSTLDDTDVGLHASESRGLRVTNTTFRWASPLLGDSGLFVDRVDDVLLQSIEITGNRFSGVGAYSVSNLTLEGSNFYEIGSPVVVVLGGTGLTFRRNTFLSSAQGISIADSANLAFESNFFYANRDGIQLAAAQNVTIVGNECLQSSQTGITLLNDARFPNPIAAVRVYHNRFDDNELHVRDDAGAEVVWDNGYPSGGNHWSGFVSPDRCRGPLQDDCSNRDGNVDVPYTGWNASEFQGHVDRYALVRPYTDSRSAPVAAFSILPASSDVETTFEFDASTSTDAEDPREFLEVRWDFDGDFTFETDWSLHLTTIHRYPDPGTYHPRVEVRDTTGASAVETLTFVVHPVPVEWTVIAIFAWAIAVPVAMGWWLWRTQIGRAHV